MSISNVSGAGVNPYAYTNRSQKAAGTGNFAEEVQKAAEGKNAAEKSGSSAWAGDMVINYPPNLAKVSNSSVGGKSKDEMTLDEYKQWVMNEISQMPVSGWARSTYSSGAIIIKEEAFERMKIDPEYEEYVLNRVRSACSVQGIVWSFACLFAKFVVSLSGRNKL